MFVNTFVFWRNQSVRELISAKIISRQKLFNSSKPVTSLQQEVPPSSSSAAARTWIRRERERAYYDNGGGAMEPFNEIKNNLINPSVSHITPPRATCESQWRQTRPHPEDQTVWWDPSAKLNVTLLRSPAPPNDFHLSKLLIIITHGWWCHRGTWIRSHGFIPHLCVSLWKGSQQSTTDTPHSHPTTFTGINWRCCLDIITLIDDLGSPLVVLEPNIKSLPGWEDKRCRAKNPANTRSVRFKGCPSGSSGCWCEQVSLVQMATSCTKTGTFSWRYWCSQLSPMKKIREN